MSTEPAVIPLEERAFIHHLGKELSVSIEVPLDEKIKSGPYFIGFLDGYLMRKFNPPASGLIHDKGHYEESYDLGNLKRSLDELLIAELFLQNPNITVEEYRNNLYSKEKWLDLS